MIKIGIVGYGYWGINLLRNFMALPNCQVKKVCDARIERLAIAKKNYPGLEITTDYNDLLKDPEITAIVIATPVFLHFELAKKALLANKNV